MRNPMLAANAPDNLRFPIIATPKVDGVRGIHFEGVMYARSLKPLPNRHLQALTRAAYCQGLLRDGMDGELIVGTDPSAQDHLCSRTTSAVMSADGAPLLSWWLFDIQRDGIDYAARHAYLREKVRIPEWSRLLPAELCRDVDDLEHWGHIWGDYEGLVLRDPSAVYKYGRSTAKEQGLLRLVAHRTAEARIIAVSEQMENLNPAERNERGYTERSSAKDGLRPKDTLGALDVEDIETGVKFAIGTGFSDELRRELWERRDTLPGLVVTYRFKPAGVKVAPRHPVFKGFRSEIDL